MRVPQRWELVGGRYPASRQPHRWALLGVLRVYRRAAREDVGGELLLSGNREKRLYKYEMSCCSFFWVICTFLLLMMQVST